MKTILFFLFSLSISLPSPPGKQLVNEDKKISNADFKLKKTRWLEPAKVFIYEVEYARSNYTLKYNYGTPTGLEILDARQNSLLTIQMSKEETALILKGKTAKKSAASKKLDIRKDISAELMDLIQLDLINIPILGAGDQISEAGYQTNSFFGIAVGLLRSVLNRLDSDCYATASCTCANIGTSSVRCKCGQNATCGTVEVQRCTQGPNGPENCRTETRCMAACR